MEMWFAFLSASGLGGIITLLGQFLLRRIEKALDRREARKRVLGEVFALDEGSFALLMTMVSQRMRILKRDDLEVVRLQMCGMIVFVRGSLNKGYPFDEFAIATSVFDAIVNYGTEKTQERYYQKLNRKGGGVAVSTLH